MSLHEKRVLYYITMTIVLILAASTWVNNNAVKGNVILSEDWNKSQMIVNITFDTEDDIFKPTFLSPTGEVVTAIESCSGRYATYRLETKNTPGKWRMSYNKKSNFTYQVL